jgi:peptide/nickel transport system substrate-binding protein
VSNQKKQKSFSRRDFLKISGTALGGAALAGCAPTPTPAPTAAPQATVTAPAQASATGEITIGYQVTMPHLDPHRNPAANVESVIRNMYECLVSFSKDVKTMEPQLATEWERIDDLTLQFKLREGVKFHNGEEFDALAVAYSLRRFKDPAVEAPYRSAYEVIDHVDVIDKYTVNVVTTKPDPVLLRRLAVYHANIVPPGYFTSASMEDIATKPIGTGPYKLVSWEEDENLVLEVNPDYWGDMPSIERVTIRAIPESGTRTSALLAGDVDLISKVSPDDYERINGSGSAAVRAREGNRVNFVYMMLSAEPFQNKLVRQAMNYGANIPGVVETVLKGRGFPRATWLNPWHQGYDPSVEPYPYDPDKAKELLAEAGYPDGFETTLYTTMGRVPKDQEVGQAIGGQLEKIGVKAEVVPLEWGTYLDKCGPGNCDPMWMASWGNYLMDADGTLFTQLHSSSLAATTFEGGYKNEEIDALLEEARSIVDQEKRTELYTEVQKLAQEDPPVIFGYAIEDAYGVSDKVEWEPRSDEMVWAKEMSLKA